MPDPIRKTSGNKPVQRTQVAQAHKKREYAVGPDGRKIDVTSVFEEIDNNTKQEQKKHDQFMHDMFGDVLDDIPSSPKEQKTQTPQKPQSNKKSQSTKKAQGVKAPKKREYAVGPDGRKIDVTSVFEEIDKNSKQAQKEHDQFMHDMFGDVLD